MERPNGAAVDRWTSTTSCVEVDAGVCADKAEGATQLREKGKKNLVDNRATSPSSCLLTVCIHGASAARHVWLLLAGLKAAPAPPRLVGNRLPLTSCKKVNLCLTPAPDPALLSCRPPPQLCCALLASRSHPSHQARLAKPCSALGALAAHRRNALQARAKNSKAKAVRRVPVLQSVHR